MMFRKITLAVATVAALSPAISGATPVEKTSLQACAKAFATSIGAPGAATSDYKLAYEGRMADASTLSFLPVEYTFDLEARDPKTGVATARVRCSANDRGAVTSLESMPVDAKVSKIAARF